MVTLKDAPGQVEVGASQLSGFLEGALDRALEKRLGDSKIVSFPGSQQPDTARMGQEPQNEILKAINEWTMRPDTIAPQEGQVIFMGQDRKIEVLDNSEFEQRMANMGQPALAGFVNQLDGIGGLDIPWGSVLLGALPGAITSEVIDGLMPPRNADGTLNFANLFVKGGVAWVGVQWGHMLVGRRAAQFFAGGLILFVLADLLPVDTWVNNLRNFFRNTATTGQDKLSAHEQELARQGQTRSPASVLNPSAADDALEALRAHRRMRQAA